MPDLDPHLYIAGCAALLLFQCAYSWCVAAGLPSDAKVPVQWGLFGRPTEFASPYIALLRAPLWAALMYGTLIGPLFFWEMPDVAPWYLAMTAAMAASANITHGIYIFFALRHVNREEEESVFQKTLRESLNDQQV